MTLTKHQKTAALDELRMLNGDPPHNVGSNICMGDGYFAQSLVGKYGMSLDELAKACGYARPPRGKTDDAEDPKTTIEHWQRDVANGDTQLSYAAWCDIKAEDNRPTDEEYREAAHERWHRDWEIEIDDGAEVSVSEDGGAYVRAWVWVYDSDAKGE